MSRTCRPAPGTRRRVTLGAARHRGLVRLGFNARATHRIVDLRECIVAAPGIVALLPPLRAALAPILREELPQAEIVEADAASFDLKAIAARAGKRIELLAQEFKILEYLLRHAGQVVTRTMLLEKVWDFHFDPKTNIVETHISRLRSKIDKGFDKPLLHTVRGAGYVIRAPD